MARYVFPDVDVLPIAKIVLVAERAGFEVRAVESLREHYTKTLRSWHERLMRNASAAVEVAGDLTFRIYSVYIASGAHGFSSGRMSVFQCLLAKPRPDGSVDLPSTADALLQ
jgi:cyclopropane-fatty-acyl-phospholipid synthase